MKTGFLLAALLVPLLLLTPSAVAGNDACVNAESTDHRDFFSDEACREDGMRAREAANDTLSTLWEQTGPPKLETVDENSDVCLNEDSFPPLPPPPKNPIHVGECSGKSRSVPDSCYHANGCFDLLSYI